MLPNADIIEILHGGGVGVLPTDTIYGLVGSALLPETVDRIYALKRRDAKKPLIVLIADIEDVERFGVVLSEELASQLQRYWHLKTGFPSWGRGPYSIILPTIDGGFEYLSRGTDTIAFRLPDKENLRELIHEAGPLVAPSANIEGGPPARTVEEARKYFGSDVDFYVDEGELTGKPSTVLEFIEEDDLVVIRA